MCFMFRLPCFISCRRTEATHCQAHLELQSLNERTSPSQHICCCDLYMQTTIMDCCVPSLWFLGLSNHTASQQRLARQKEIPTMPNATSCFNQHVHSLNKFKSSPSSKVTAALILPFSLPRYSFILFASMRLAIYILYPQYSLHEISLLEFLFTPHFSCYYCFLKQQAPVN